MQLLLALNWLTKAVTTILNHQIRSVVDGKRGACMPVQLLAFLYIRACLRYIVYSHQWAGTQASISIFNERATVASWNVLAIKVLQQIVGIDMSAVTALRDKRIAHFRISSAIHVIRRRMGFLVSEVCCGRLRLGREKIRLQILGFTRFSMGRAWRCNFILQLFYRAILITIRCIVPILWDSRKRHVLVRPLVRAQGCQGARECQRTLLIPP